MGSGCDAPPAATSTATADGGGRSEAEGEYAWDWDIGAACEASTRVVTKPS